MTTAPIDLESLQRLVPEAVFFPGDPGEGTLSVPVAGGTAVELDFDGSVWFRLWSPDHSLKRDERAGFVDPALPPEEAAVVLRTLVIAAVKKYLPPDEEPQGAGLKFGPTPMDPEAMAAVREATAGMFPPSVRPETTAIFTPDPVQPDWANQPGRDPQEGYWHYTPEDLESDSFGPPDDPEAQHCDI